MKAGLVVVITVLIFSTLFGTKVNAQTIAIGHVSAEIVESVSAASAANSNFELAKTHRDLSFDLTSETLDLGAITLFSGKDIACNVVLKPAALSDSQGNGFFINPAVRTGEFATVNKSNGSLTIQLGGTTTRTDS